MKKVLILLLIFFFITLHAQNGVTNIKSSHNVQATVDSLLKILNAKGMKIFAQIDHSKGAKSVGKELHPTQLIIFGNPNVGTILMQCNQQVGLDLPQKMLVWQDAKNQTWISFNNPNYLAERHNIQKCNEKLITKIKTILKNIAIAASK